MKVTHDIGDRLILRGVPQGRGLIFAFLICAGIFGVALLFAYIFYSKSNSIRAAIGPLIGAGFMFFLLICLVLVSIKREQLTLDKVTQSAIHETWSLFFGSRKTVTHPFDRIHAVAIERSLQSPGGGKGFPIEVTKVRLLILGPRGGKKAIDLDEVQSADPTPVEALAKQVASFLDKPLQSMGSHEEPPRRAKRRD